MAIAVGPVAEGRVTDPKMVNFHLVVTLMCVKPSRQISSFCVLLHLDHTVKIISCTMGTGEIMNGTFAGAASPLSAQE